MICDIHPARKPIARVIGLLLVLLAAACQTVPQPRQQGFTERQEAVLKANGFMPADDRWELGIGNRLLFGTDESALLSPQRDRLNGLAGALLEVGIHGARVEGNADATGSPRYNRELSQRRADAVKQALVSGGMREDAVQAVGLGHTNPIASNRTAEGRRENRRVVIIISAVDADQR